VIGQGFVVVAWNNGSHHRSGAGYGFKMSEGDRDTYLNREWGAVELHLGGAEPARVNIDKASLWGNSCRELISREIGQWLINRGLAPWPNGSPPKFRLVPKGERAFEVQPA
jgi:hypothetical protein